MVAFPHDQAEGLRRLLQADCVRVLALASGRNGVGRTTLLCNLAALLARRGRRVLVLGGQRRPLPGDLVPPPRHDLGAVLKGERRLEEVVVEGPAGVGRLELGGALLRLARLAPSEQEALASAFAEAARAWDVLLLDAPPGLQPPSLALLLAAQETLLAAGPEPESITATYALMKRLARDFAQRRFHLVVNRAGREDDARAIYNNLVETAGRYLGARLEWLGHVPPDPQMRQAARLGKTPALAFPDSPAVLACRALVARIEEWPLPDAETARPDAFLNRLVMTSRLAAENAHL